MPQLSTCLWYDNQAEEAAKLYTSIFPGGKIHSISRYGKEGFEFHGRPEGSVMTVEFEFLGHKYLALNGGPRFRFSEAFSIVVSCDTQEEIDFYWAKLTENGGQESQCGWLKDRFGLSWQVAPKVLGTMLTTGNPAQAARVTKAVMSMRKFDLKSLEAAFKAENDPSPIS